MAFLRWLPEVMAALKLSKEALSFAVIHEKRPVERYLL